MATISAGAITPVTSPFNTSTAYSGTFIPTLWSAKLNVKFYASSTFADVANTNWQGDISGMGDKVIINSIPTITISDYTVGMSLNYEVPAPSTIELQIDKAKYFGVNISDVLEYQAKPKLMGMFTDDASQQLRIQIDADNWITTLGVGATVLAATGNYGATAGVNSGAYNLGTDTAPVTLTAANILSTITSMAACLDEQNVPETERSLIITPYDRQLLMQSNLAQAQFMGDQTSILRNGKIGSIDRFTVYVTNLLPTGALSGAWTSGVGTAVGVGTSKLKRHCMVACHKSALSFASQITKVETLQNPTDFGNLVRGLNVYGRKTTKPEGLVLAVVA
jgi:hypothetical protein